MRTVFRIKFNLRAEDLSQSKPESTITTSKSENIFCSWKNREKARRQQQQHIKIRETISTDRFHLISLCVFFTVEKKRI